MFFRDDAVRVAALSEYVDRQARDLRLGVNSLGWRGTILEDIQR
jgi:hypothetical protein